ncbi:hypothetical protein FRC08_011661 [Ceratobasidium sp. 394]|nr:hypothetical protein FRC08_011661 [Ceratobasidium sp. 394]
MTGLAYTNSKPAPFTSPVVVGAKTLRPSRDAPSSQIRAVLENASRKGGVDPEKEMDETSQD